MSYTSAIHLVIAETEVNFLSTKSTLCIFNIDFHCYIQKKKEKNMLLVNEIEIKLYGLKGGLYFLFLLFLKHRQKP